ncbi:MAG: hypothetical protein AAGC44_05155 [Planctomycetota bacterium]
MTREQVLNERDRIIDATVKRAMDGPRWRDRIKAKLGAAFAPELLRRMIGECLDGALRDAKRDE